jgi:Flp pilus assembly protein TadG
MRSLRAIGKRLVRITSKQGLPALLRSGSGQNLVEVALITPMLLGLLVGIIELGRFAYIGIVVGNAARAGAAYGAQTLAQSADTAGIQTAADNDFQSNGQSVSNLTVNSSVSCGCDNGGAVTAEACTGNNSGTCTAGHWVVMVAVETKGTFSSLFKFPGIPTSVTIDRTCTMRVNQQ